MEKVAGCHDFSVLVGHDVDDIAFAWVEFNVLGMFPFSQRVKVFLTLGLVVHVSNSSVQKAAICKVPKN